MSFMNTSGPSGTARAMMATGPEPDEDEYDDSFEPGIGLALAAHDRLDRHAADIQSLKDWTGMPEPDQDEGPGQPDYDNDND